MKKRFAYILMPIFMLMITGCGPNGAVQVMTPIPNATTAADGTITVPAVSVQVNAPGPNPLINQPAANGQIAGALLGLWHGFISPVTMLISFINPNVGMYEVHNDGSPYNLGFFLGILILMALAGAVGYSQRR